MKYRKQCYENGRRRNLVGHGCRHFMQEKEEEMNRKGKLWKYGYGYKENGKKVHSDSLFQFKHEERATKSCKQLLMPADSHQFQKFALKCHNTPFLPHS